MKAGHGFGQAPHQLRRQPAGVAQPSEQRLLIEAAHDDDMVTRGKRLIRPEAQLPVDSLQDRAHLKIDFRRDAAIDLKLALAHRLALLGRRIIHVGKFDGAFELVGPVADQEDDGAMGFHTLDLRARQAVMLRPGEELDHSLLVIRHDRARRHGPSLPQVRARRDPFRNVWRKLRARCRSGARSHRRGCPARCRRNGCDRAG